jgi:hypothetical protein
MAVPAFNPPHPVAIFRVLKQAWREYLASGNACAIDVVTPPNQLITATTTVSGTVHVDASVPQMPPQAQVQLWMAGFMDAARNTPINPKTGAYTVTFPASTFQAAGTAHVEVFAPYPLHTTQSGTFTVT